MNKKVLMVTLSMALVVGTAGIVNAATTGSNTSDTSSQPYHASAYENQSNVTDSGTIHGTPAQTDVNTLMNANAPMNNQGLNMPLNNHMQTMPVGTPMHEQMRNSQSMQGMNGTGSNQAIASRATQHSGQNLHSNTMMGS